MTNTFERGGKKQLAIKIINENLDKDFFVVADMIAVALDLNKYAGRAYYKYMIKHGLISKFETTDTPWKMGKATKEPKAPKTVKLSTIVKKVNSEFTKKSLVKNKVVSTTPDEKPATAAIRDFVQKQKAARQA